MGKAGMSIAIACAAVSCTVAAVLLMKRVQSWSKWNRVESIVRDFEDGCSTSSHQLRQLGDAMTVEMHAGLASEGGSKLRMLLTFVQNLPTGDEKGLYYALHLGRSRFRVLRVQLGGKEAKVVNQEFEEISIPQNLMVGAREDFHELFWELFDYIVSGLENFARREGDGFKLHPGRKRELGFTLSFPMKKTSVSSGMLTERTKAFAIEEMVGNDVGECLQRAMTRKGLDMRVSALVNDTVGTLAGGRYYDEDVMAAVILGTGTNACYVERADSITKGQGLLAKSGGMVINMEWGNFWSSHLPRTLYDEALDVDSLNPGEQGFEKLVSGLYLGEIVRRVIRRIAQESDVFGHTAPSSLSAPFILSTPDVSAMHQDESTDLREVDRVMKDVLGVLEIPLRVKKVIVKICDLVTERAARLAAAGIVAILKKIGRDGTAGIGSGRILSDTANKMKRTVIAMDGSLYEQYPKFRNYLQVAVAELLGEEAAPNIIIQLSKYRSGIGGALLAASNSIYSDE